MSPCQPPFSHATCLLVPHPPAFFHLDLQLANLFAGPALARPLPNNPNQRTAQRHSNHPLQTGLIIAASVLVAAGIAIYESPQVRQWVDQSRRKIAVALHSLGDEIQPRRNPEPLDDFELRKRRREELVRRNRNELIRRAREEGIAVDLDELARIGQEDVEPAERRARRGTVASQRSFDDLVGSDGMLKRTEAETTATETLDGGLRNRSAAGFAAGAAVGAAATNPFSDDHVLFDRDDEEASSPRPFTYTEPGTRESSTTVEGDVQTAPPTSENLIDLDSETVYMHPLEAENPQTASIPSSIAPASEHSNDNDQAAQSFYSFVSEDDQPPEPEHLSTGTLTPRSERSAFTGASVVGSHADDIAIMSMQNDTDHDARSEIFSEGGFTEAGFSEAGFSELGENGVGAMTPSSWTDVGSDDESEWGGMAQGGHVSQVQVQQAQQGMGQ